MNNKLICPFCQQELHKDSDGYYTCYTDNCDCWANGGNGASGSESLWLTLIRTRKALGVAIERLEQIAHESFQGDQQSINMGFHIRAAAALTDIEQITALEQKDK